MAKIKLDCSIDMVTVYGEGNTRYYHPYLEESWNELKEKLNIFGISFSSLYEIEFSDKEYKLCGKEQPFGGRDVFVYYGNTRIAKAYISGSNYCDREGRLDIYLSDLKNAYVKK